MELVATTERPRFADLFRFTASERIVFGVCVLVSLVAKAGAFAPLAYSIDDYNHGQMSHAALHGHHLFSLTQGRYTAVIQNELFDLLSLMPPSSSPFWSAVSIACLAFLAVLACRQWLLAGDTAASALAGCVLCVHPFLSENFTFRLGVWTFFFLALNYALLSLSTLDWKRITGLGLLLALVFVQQSASFVAIIWLFTAFFTLLRRPAALGATIKHVIVPQAVTFAAGAVFHVLINKVVLRVTHTEAGRFAFIEPSQWKDRIKAVVALLPDLVYRDAPGTSGTLVPLLTKLVFLAVALVAVAVLGARWVQRRRRGDAVLLLALLTTFGAGLLATLGVLWITNEFYPVPRVLYATGVFQAGVIAAAFMLAGVRLRPLLIALGCILVASYAGINNQVFRDQLRVNLRDQDRANRIIYQLERTPGFDTVHSVVVIGTFSDYAMPLHMRVGDLNASAFGVFWANVPLLREVSGYDLQPAYPAEENTLAREHCATAKPWPSPDAVTIKNGVGVICVASAQ